MIKTTTKKLKALKMKKTRMAITMKNIIIISNKDIIIIIIIIIIIMRSKNGKIINTENHWIRIKIFK